MRHWVCVCLTAAISSPAIAQGPSPWWPETGTVILSGGGLKLPTAEALVDRVIAAAGGPDALIVIIPTAHEGLPARLPSSEPDVPHIKNMREFFASRGARNVVFLHTRDRQVASSAQFVAVLGSARAVFLSGGAFGVLDNTYHDTLVAKELKGLLARGGVLAGDSAGAITLGCLSLRWDRTLKALVKATDGLCVLPRVTVTPHVQKIEGDEQTADVAAYVTAHPATIGINISEDTMLVIRGGVVEAVGSGGATIFDPAVDNSKPYLQLSGGQRRDLTMGTSGGRLGRLRERGEW